MRKGVVALLCVFMEVLLLQGICLGGEFQDMSCKPVKHRYYDDRERGWFFREYCEPVKPKEKTKPESRVEKASDPENKIDWAKLQDPSYLDSLDVPAFKRTFESVKNDVVYHPTKEKMLVYLQLQNYIKNKSMDFAYIWRDVLLDHPELDVTFKHPASNFGAMTANTIKNQENRRIMAQLREEIGLFFFVSGDCPYCHEEAKIVNLLVADHGIAVRTVSGDYCVSGFTECSVEPVLFEKLNVRDTPTLVAVYRDPNDNPQIQTIATGIVTEDDLVNRLVFYYKYFKTGKYSS